MDRASAVSLRAPIRFGFANVYVCWGCEKVTTRVITGDENFFELLFKTNSAIYIQNLKSVLTDRDLLQNTCSTCRGEVSHIKNVLITCYSLILTNSQN